MTFEPSVVDTAAGPVEMAESGVGSTLLIAHGMPGDWSQAIAIGRELADHHRVLLVSRPGYGRTPLSTGPTWAGTARAHVALLDALAIERAAVLGISGGGPSSFWFAAHHRDRCAGLILACAVNPDVSEIPPAMRIFHALPGIRTWLHRAYRNRQIAKLDSPDDFLARALAEANAVERERLEQDPVGRDWLIEFVHHNLRVSEDLRPFRHDLRAIARHQRRRRGLTWPEGPPLPTLVLHGDQDDVVDLDSGRRYAELIPGAELEIYEHGGHGFLFTFREEALAAIRGFLARADVA